MEPGAPRETTRQSVRFEVLDGGLDFEIREHGETVWVALSGVFNAARLGELRRRIGPVLRARGRRVVLDARRLQHLDYRCVPDLLVWHDSLRSFNHQLLLYGWNAYLRAILAIGDQGTRVGPGPLGLPLGPAGAAAAPELVR